MSVTGKNSLGLPNISATEMVERIAEGLANLNSGVTQPMMFLGTPGVGKSSIIECQAAKSWALLIDLRLSSCDATDIGGIPIVAINDMGNQVKQNVQSGQLPFKGVFNLGAYQHVILLLDEANLASPDVMKALYSLLQERRVNEHTLIPECMIVLAGNRADDGIQVEDLGTALNNRIQAYNIVISAKEWRENMKQYAGEYRKGNIRMQLMNLFVNNEAPYTRLNEANNIGLWQKEWEAHVQDQIALHTDQMRKNQDWDGLAKFGENEIAEITQKALALKKGEKPESVKDFYLPFMLRRLNIVWMDEISDVKALESAYKEWLGMAAVDEEGNPLGNGKLMPVKQFAVMTEEEKNKWQKMLVEIAYLAQKDEPTHTITDTDEYRTLRHKDSVVKMFGRYLEYFRKQSVRYQYSPVINAFISRMTDNDLCSLGTKDQEESHTQFASPRSWTNFFDLLGTPQNQERLNKLFTAESDQTNEEYSAIVSLARATVGVNGANKFMKHLMVFKDFPSMDTIVANPTGKLLTQEQMSKEELANYAMYLHTMLSMLKANQKNEAKAILSQLTLPEYGNLANSDLATYFVLVLKQKFPILLMEKFNGNKDSIHSYLNKVANIV